MEPNLHKDDLRRLRDRLTEIGYTVDGVTALLGPLATAALSRNETTPARRATAGGSALETLVRLWSLQLPVPDSAARAALGGVLDALVGGGLLCRDGDEVRALVDIRPYGDETVDWWVLADLTPGLDGRLAPVPADHVLGVNAASSTLAQITVRPSAGRALDLGTGCGVQALHLSRHVDRIVATDVNLRALALVRLTAQINGLDLDLRDGNLFEPVRGERFDLIVSNPPFVVSPGGGHVYRDSGLAGDEVSRRVIAEGAAHLAEGGWLQVLANWMHVRGADWRERVGGWVAPTGCDGWVVEREVQDPAEYVELWLRDSGDVASRRYLQAYDAWLRWFEEQRVDGIGFGWVTLHRSGAERPDVRLEEWPHPVEQPLGPHILDHFARLDGLRRLAADRDLLGARLRVAEDVRQEQVGPPGAEHPDVVVLRQQAGMRRARQVDPALAGLVGACDGDLPVGVLVDATAQILGLDPVTWRDHALPQMRELVTEGFLHLA